MQMWFTGEYREVVENERLVYTESMSDENGNVISPSDMGMPEGHPVTTEVRVELEDVGGRTKMVMTHAGIPSRLPRCRRMDHGVRQARRPHPSNGFRPELNSAARQLDRPTRSCRRHRIGEDQRRSRSLITGRREPVQRGMKGASPCARTTVAGVSAAGLAQSSLATPPTRRRRSTGRPQ